MTNNVEAYVYEYLSNCEGSYGGKCYAWEKIDINNYKLRWQLGKYSYNMKSSFEEYGKRLLSRYPGVYIAINGDIELISNKAIVEEPPVIIEPKPPEIITCPVCNGSGKTISICPTCKHNTYEIPCYECGGTGKIVKKVV
jgi:hypothetical protein